MKKNKMMRLASLLLVLVLMTSSVVGGTFAKYVTEVSSSDSARVAKWGVQGSITGEAFAWTYDVETDVENEFALAVESTTADKVVAPGTTGIFTGIALTGTPEVAVNITNTATLTLTGWEVDDTYYCPIVINVNGTDIKGESYNSADEFAAAVKAAIETANGYYAPNTNLANVEKLNGNYTWTWAFNDDDNHNPKDTALGNAAAGLNGGTAATIELEVATLVEQIN